MNKPRKKVTNKKVADKIEKAHLGGMLESHPNTDELYANMTSCEYIKARIDILRNSSDGSGKLSIKRIARACGIPNSESVHHLISGVGVVGEKNATRLTIGTRNFLSLKFMLPPDVRERIRKVSEI